MTCPSGNSTYHKILETFPNLANPVPNFKKPVLHNTKHYIETKSAPVFSRPRRLHPKLLEAVKKEFRFLVEQGICRPSKSPWASPIHVVPKSNATYRICGDYRRLNSITVADRYPIPHIHDITNVLYKKSFFFKN